MTDDHDTSTPQQTYRKARRDTYSGKRLKVTVTEADIDLAIKSSSRHCMIADAIKRLKPNLTRVDVDIQTIRFSDAKLQRRYTYLTPPAAQRRLIYFDRGVKPKPFSFNLSAVQITQTKPHLIKNGTVKRHIATLGANLPGVIKKREVEAIKRAERGTGYAISLGNQGREHDKIVGGKPPPAHHPSRVRTFGMKGFTWDDTEAVPQDPTI